MKHEEAYFFDLSYPIYSIHYFQAERYKNVQSTTIIFKVQQKLLNEKTQ